MNPGDMCLALVCPCMVYGQILEHMDPNGSKSTDSCHTSTGCMVWTGLIGASALGIQIPLLISDGCSWLPTTYLGGVMDIREFFLILPYFVPHWLCHCPFRQMLLGKKGEDSCSTCMDVTFCSCCSLASLKAEVELINPRFDAREASLRKWLPFFGPLDEPAEATQEEVPLFQNTMSGKPSTTGAPLFYNRALRYYE